MSHQIFNGSCECNANQFSFNQPPIGRFYCHCLVCQKYTGRDFSDVSVFLKKDIQELNVEQTQFKRLRLPPNIRRGKCKKCNKPTLELGILGQLVFVPTPNIKNPQNLPLPSMHLFYHRRIHDMDDHLPKYHGYFHSEVMASILLAKGMVKEII